MRRVGYILLTASILHPRRSAGSTEPAHTPRSQHMMCCVIWTRLLPRFVIARMLASLLKSWRVHTHTRRDTTGQHGSSAGGKEAPGSARRKGPRYVGYGGT